MRIWLDAQLSPAIAEWMEGTFELEGVLPVQLDPQLLTAKDGEIFAAAGRAGAVVSGAPVDLVRSEAARAAVN